MKRAAARATGCVSLGLSLAGALAAALPAAAAETAPRRLVLGTGGVGGIYYAAGRAICAIVNKKRTTLRIRCTADTTPGSMANLRTLRTGGLDMAIVQSDWQHHALHGTSRFRDDGPDPRLRAAFSLHHEAFTTVTRPEAGIRRFADIRGKRVNIGNRGSGHRATAFFVFRRLGWRAADFAALLDHGMAEQARTLCDGKADALLVSVGHPNHSVSDALATCKAVLVPLTRAQVATIIEGLPYYAPAMIRGALYQAGAADVRTFATVATVVTSTGLLSQTVYDVVKTVFRNLRALRRSHPALEALQAKRMANDGLIAPLHDGAARYFGERKLRP